MSVKRLREFINSTYNIVSRLYTLDFEERVGYSFDSRAFYHLRSIFSEDTNIIEMNLSLIKKYARTYNLEITPKYLKIHGLELVLSCPDFDIKYGSDYTEVCLYNPVAFFLILTSTSCRKFPIGVPYTEYREPIHILEDNDASYLLGHLKRIMTKLCRVTG